LKLAGMDEAVMGDDDVDTLALLETRALGTSVLVVALNVGIEDGNGRLGVAVTLLLGAILLPLTAFEIEGDGDRLVEFVIVGIAVSFVVTLGGVGTTMLPSSGGSKATGAVVDELTAPLTAAEPSKSPALPVGDEDDALLLLLLLLLPRVATMLTTTTNTSTRLLATTATNLRCRRRLALLLLLFAKSSTVSVMLDVVVMVVSTTGIADTTCCDSTKKA
jgi:hypothetical protein